MLRTLTATQLKHLWVRTCFAPPPAEILTQRKPAQLQAVVADILQQCTQPQPLQTVSDGWFNYISLQQAAIRKTTPGSDEAKTLRAMVIKEQDVKSRDLNIEWYNRIFSTPTPFLEKLTLFWHGHFACRNTNPYIAQQLNNVLRENALGNFKTLLLAVSKTPAMLQYLNNQQNVKAHPNENFAREVMELFTIGRGNYTEDDIKQAARAFTGFAYRNAEYRFNDRQHDEGLKTFMGKTGHFTGEDIIDIILDHPKTAEFIARKAYLFFVADTLNEQHVQELGNVFYRSKYNLHTLFTHMFTAPWFYSSAVMGNKIKSPAELLAGLARTFGVNFNNTNLLVQMQRGMGQYLFNPPNVAGWPTGQAWIDSSTLVLRMHAPQVLLANTALKVKPKADIEQEAVISNNQPPAGNTAVTPAGNTTVNWQAFAAQAASFAGTPESLAAYLLQVPLPASQLQQVVKEGSLPAMATAITSLPEYQLT